jgi:hypothetical protein
MSTTIQHIPAAIEQQALTTITAMTERGLKEPERLHYTCRSIAKVLLAKWDSADRKMLRTLTNIMIIKAQDVTDRL